MLSAFPLTEAASSRLLFLKMYINNVEVKQSFISMHNVYCSMLPHNKHCIANS